MLLRTLPLVNLFDHEIITLKSEGILASSFRIEGIKVTNLNSIFDLLPTVNKIHPSLVITYLFHADFWGRILLGNLTNCRIIPFLRTTYNYPRYLPIRIFERLTSFFVKNYLANSESVKKFYVTKLGVKADKITVIPNGIDLKKYRKSNIIRSRYRNHFHITNTDKVIVCVANLLPNKGHKYLLQAFDEVYKKHPGVWLFLVGDGEMHTTLEKQIANYPSRSRVLFMGDRIDVSSILSASDIFVLPTLFEGMSNAIMEAMASSIPVITTDIPENRELIVNNYNGYLVRSQDALILKQQLLYLISNIDIAKKAGSMGKALMSSKYNIHLLSNKLTFYLLSCI